MVASQLEIIVLIRRHAGHADHGTPVDALLHPLLHHGALASLILPRGSRIVLPTPRNHSCSLVPCLALLISEDLTYVDRFGF